MAYENSGRLFKNDKKTKDSQPDYTGDFTNANGDKKQVSAWFKEGTQGRAKWLSFRVSEPHKADVVNPPAVAEPSDDEIPF